MDVTKLEEQVKKIMDEIFSHQEDKEKKDRIEAALLESASTIETLRSDIAAFKAKISEMEEVIKASQDKEASLTSEHASLTEKFQDAIACIRTNDLATAGVLMNKDAQTEKVKKMSDEEFAAYKEELVAIRTAALEEASSKVKADKEEEDAKAAEEQKAKDEAAARAKEDEATAALAAIVADIDSIKAEIASMSGKVDEKAVDGLNSILAGVDTLFESKDLEALTTLVANAKQEVATVKETIKETDESFVAPARVGTTEFSALNFELLTSDDLFSKYRSMGEAMAKAMLEE